MKKDIGLQSILAEKEIPHLDESFEERMMLQLHKKAIDYKTENHYFRLMYVFFALGLIFGILVSYTMINKEFSFLGMDFIVNKVVLLIPLVVALLFLFEKVYKTILFRSGKEEIINF
ncbi:MAG: hypothetical protein COC06_10405 [Bacteroidales bacterium]|nr:MAG: hypothetical protein COC06_10405 [Bacteroidales bacterium]